MSRESDIELGLRLKAAREYLGLSQQEVSQRVKGLSRSAISLIEAGQRKVSATELVILASVYETPIDEIAGVEAYSAGSEEIDVVARQMQKLSQQDRAEVLRFTQLLLSKNGQGNGNDKRS